MHRWTWALLLTACSGEVSEELTACSGAHEGVYTGDESGAVQGTLEVDGTLSLTFDLGGLPVGADAEVDAAGDITGCQSTVCVGGTYDFPSCSASGTWTSDIGAQGSWELEAL